MKAKSNLLGTSTFNPVTNIGATGFWLLVDDKEYFVPFADYPVFRRATIEQVFDVRPAGPGHYHWPGLDADVELDALENPDRFPLVWKE